MHFFKTLIFKTVVAIVLLLSTAGCKETIMEPVASCTLTEINTPSNPKAATYQAILDKYVKKGFPGLILYVKTPAEGIWTGSAGKARIETGDPIKPCHLMYSHSMAKTFTAVSIMKLAEDGKISLDAAVKTYLSADITNRIANANKATVRQLLKHTSGIRNYDAEPAFRLDLFNTGVKELTHWKALKYVYDKPALFEPDTDIEYSNTNYVLLAMIIDQVTRTSHADFFTNRIFRPLGLTNTYYKNEPGYPTPAGYTNTYFDQFSDGKLTNFTDMQSRSATAAYGDDGILATAADFGRFVEAVFKGNLVSPASLEAMTTWIKMEDPLSDSDFYGLGLMNRATPYGNCIGHEGDYIGASSFMYYFPQSDVTIVVGTNRGMVTLAGFKLFKEELRNEIAKVAVDR
jgi:D-alanyl-D-alanine carboxypeptidase